MKIIQIIRKIPVIGLLIDNIEKKYCELTYKKRELKRMPFEEESRGNDYPDKTFFVIRRNDSNVGLFSYVISALGGIMYALDRGYIPIIDMKNYPNPYSDENIGDINAWEYFFEQPCKYRLEDIEHANHVILSAGIPTWDCPNVSILEEADNSKIIYWKNAWKKYIRINKQTMDYIQNKAKEIGCNYTCGVIIRGTDYIRNKPIGHPIQPTPDQAIETVNELIKKWDYDNFFITTEDAQIYNLFKSKSKYSFTSISVFRLDDEDVTKGNIPQMISKNIGGFQHGLDYLTNVWVVSHCDSIIAGKCGAAIAAKLMSDYYKNEFYFDLGVYK